MRKADSQSVISDDVVFVLSGMGFLVLAWWGSHLKVIKVDHTVREVATNCETVLGRTLSHGEPQLIGCFTP